MTGGALATGKSIVAGSSTAGAEIQITATSNAGKIYLYSAGTATGNRGIWLKNADATLSSALFIVNQSNQISAMATVACSPTITGTLTLSKTTDASGTANNSPALIVGGAATSTHLEFDSNEIMAKATGTTVAALYFNNEGGAVAINSGYGTTSVSTAVDDSGLRVYARRAANKSVIDAYNGFAAASGTYSWGLNHLAPNIVAGANTCLLTGVANGTNNQGVLEFHYAGSNNADNYVGLGLYGNNGLLKIFKDKHVEFAGTITSGTWQGTAIAAAYIGAHNHAAGDINSGTLGVARGGTGAGTFSTNAILIGNGTSAIQASPLNIYTNTTNNALVLESTSRADYFQLDGSHFWITPWPSDAVGIKVTNNVIFYQQSRPSIADTPENTGAIMTITEDKKVNLSYLSFATFNTNNVATEKASIHYDSTLHTLNFSVI